MAANSSQPEFGFNDFRRYQNGEMSVQEQHVFEKRMLEEPLVADAYEGFLALHEDQIDYQPALANLNEALKERTKPERKSALPLWVYGSAASVCLLVGFYWLFFISNKNTSSKDVAFDTSVEEPDHYQAAPKTNLKEEPLPADSKPARTLKSTPAPPAQTPLPAETEAVVQAEPSSPEDKVLGNKLDEAIAANDLEHVGIVEVVPASAPAAASAAQVPQRKSVAKFSQDYAKGASIALPSTRPVPVNGWEPYQSYLSKNSVTDGKSGDVVVTFTVQTDSTLSAFSAKGDPSLIDKAIFMIKNGPVWVPAQFNGKLISTQTTVTIQFRHSN